MGVVRLGMTPLAHPPPLNHGFPGVRIGAASYRSGDRGSDQLITRAHIINEHEETLGERQFTSSVRIQSPQSNEKTKQKTKTIYIYMYIVFVSTVSADTVEFKQLQGVTHLMRTFFTLVRVCKYCKPRCL